MTSPSPVWNLASLPDTPEHMGELWRGQFGIYEALLYMKLIKNGGHIWVASVGVTSTPANQWKRKTGFSGVVEARKWAEKRMGVEA